MNLSQNTLAVAVGLLLSLAACRQAEAPPASTGATYLEEIQNYQQERDRRFRSPFSQLAMVHRAYLRDAARTAIGNDPEADVKLTGEDVAPVHAVVEGSSDTPTLRAAQGPVWSLDDPPQPLTELRLEDRASFRIGRFNFLYVLHPSWGRTFEVYDTRLPALLEFTGMEYFPIDPAYRVTGTVVPHSDPESIHLIDSHGSQRPYWIYGELRFELHGTPCRLEVYSTTTEAREIEERGFMLMFTDETSGKESYPLARYLDVEGSASGTITVDFNQAYNPPCNYSAAFTCPFPRKQNRLPVAVRAGQKWYRGGSSETTAR